MPLGAYSESGYVRTVGSQQFVKCKGCERTILATVRPDYTVDDYLCAECSRVGKGNGHGVIQPITHETDTELFLKSQFRCTKCGSIADFSQPNYLTRKSPLCPSCFEAALAKPLTLADLIEEWRTLDHHHTETVSKLDDISTRLGKALEGCQGYVVHNGVGYEYDNEYNVIYTHRVIEASGHTVEASEDVV